MLGTGDGVAVWLVLGLMVEAVHLGRGDHYLVVSHSHRKKLSQEITGHQILSFRFIKKPFQSDHISLAGLSGYYNAFI